MLQGFLLHLLTNTASTCWVAGSDVFSCIELSFRCMQLQHEVLGERTCLAVHRGHARVLTRICIPVLRQENQNAVDDCRAYLRLWPVQHARPGTP
jgi:hypothetical protein